MNENIIAPIPYPYRKRNFELRIDRGATKTGLHGIVIRVYEDETPLGWCTLAPKRTSVVLKERALGKEIVFPSDYIEPAIRQFKERHYIEKFLARNDPSYNFEDTLML